jgi:hypothetical protein
VLATTVAAAEGLSPEVVAGAAATGMNRSCPRSSACAPGAWRRSRRRIGPVARAARTTGCHASPWSFAICSRCRCSCAGRRRDT